MCFREFSVGLCFVCGLFTLGLLVSLLAGLLFVDLVGLLGWVLLIGICFVALWCIAVNSVGVVYWI